MVYDKIILGGKMRIKDMKQAVRLLEEEWDLGELESGAPKHLCAWIYLIDLLQETEKCAYYKENGKLLGFCGYSNNKSKKYFLRKKFYSMLRKILFKSKKIKDVKALEKYYDNYWYVPKKYQDYFDGEISMLILDKKLRGKGIGKELLRTVFEYAKKDGMKNLQILTDESCNFYIYESLGCKKIYETEVESMEYGRKRNSTKEKAYIYEKVLKEYK